jgi:hypothetical protein
VPLRGKLSNPIRFLLETKIELSISESKNKYGHCAEQTERLLRQKVSGKELKVGDQVMLYNPAVKLGRSPKLHCPWEIQPYDILEKMSDVDYKIRKRNGKAKIVHFNRLKKFVPSNQGSKVV